MNIIVVLHSITQKMKFLNSNCSIVCSIRVVCMIIKREGDDQNFKFIVRKNIHIQCVPKKVWIKNFYADLFTASIHSF